MTEWEQWRSRNLVKKAEQIAEDADPLSRAPRIPLADTSLNAEHVALARAQLKEAHTRVEEIHQEVKRMGTRTQQQIFRHLFGYGRIKSKESFASVANALGLSENHVKTELDGLWNKLGFKVRGRRYAHGKDPLSEELERIDRLSALLEEAESR